MPARPGDWSLISDSSTDPVPGDPDAVRTAASYYGNMAQTIINEAHRLKVLGDDDDLVGKYSKSLKKELHDLADEVHKAHKRYDGVHKALVPFATALDTAKSKSLSALHDAEHAKAQQTSAAGTPNPQATPGGKALTDAQKTQAKNHAKAVSAANDAMNAAKTKLSNALSDLNDAGKAAAKIINEHDDDALKDHPSFWDVFVKILKVLVEIANYVVIALAILSLCIPGLDLLGAIFLISLAILATDTLLAATGNGSWLDVGIDFVSLVTCGIGGGAAKASEMAAEDAGKAGAKLIAKEAADLGEQGIVKRTLTYFARRSLGKRFITQFMDSHGGTSLAERFAAGDSDVAKSLNQLKALTEKFPDSTEIAGKYAAAQRYAKITRYMTYGGNGLVAGNTVLSDHNIPGLEGKGPLSGLKNATTMDSPNKAHEFHWTPQATRDFYTGVVTGQPLAGLAAAGGSEMTSGDVEHSG